MGVTFTEILNVKDLETGYFNNSKFINVPAYKINITAKKSELIALIGSNGNGKTTFLKSLSGILPIKSGSIEICNNNIHNISSEQRAKLISIATTDTFKIGYFTVFDFVMFGRFPYSGFWGKVNKNDIDIVNNSISDTQLYSLKDKYFNHLSDGEKQRAVIARTLAQNSELILLDEPTAYLDLKNKFEIIELLKNLCSKYKKTIIFSTHDINIALNSSDKIWLLTKCNIINKIPEEMIEDVNFANEFYSENINIDKKNINLNFINKTHKTINLIDNSDNTDTIIKALNRIGYKIESNKNSILSVIAEKRNNSFKFKLNENKNDTIFSTLEELILYLKNL